MARCLPELARFDPTVSPLHQGSPLNPSRIAGRRGQLGPFDDLPVAETERDQKEQPEQERAQTLNVSGQLSPLRLHSRYAAECQAR